MNPTPKKINKNHPWRKWSIKKAFIREPRNLSDIKSIVITENQRGMSRNVVTNGFRSKMIMDNQTLSEL